jgi:aminocarboxymuconate-semialdehyde decarboxylase
MNRRDFLVGTAIAGGASLAGPLVQMKAAAQTSGGPRKPIIDTHAHWYPPAWVDMLAKEGPKHGAKVGKNDKGYVTYSRGKFATVFTPDFVDLSERIKAMDKQGVDIHALSLTSPMVYWAPADLGLALSQAYNDSCVEAHAKYPNRFVGMATLPMQDPKLALQELERVSKLKGMRGLYLSTMPAGQEMDFKEFFPIYAKCEQLGWPIFLHSVDIIAEMERLPRFYLRNLLGNPYETGIAAAYLIFGGVMDTFPKLDVMLPHGGGTFPWLSGRFDRGVACRPELKHMKQPATAYLRRFHYDTITHNPQILSYLIQYVGADRVVLGSDYCYDMGYDMPVQALEKTPVAERFLILSTNAAKLLKIQV